MKKIITLLLVFSSALLLAQEEKLPKNIEDNFGNKYPTANLDDWRYENDTYYIEFSLKSNFCTSVFNGDGVWIETAEIISDFDIPLRLQNYIADKFPNGKISYSEKVESQNSKRFFRVNLFDNNTFIVITCNTDGSDIKVIREKTDV